ncbi:MAG: hypothetical protein ACJAR6_001555, partial [Oleispira sp.]
LRRALFYPVKLWGDIQRRHSITFRGFMTTL